MSGDRNVPGMTVKAIVSVCTAAAVGGGVIQGFCVAVDVAVGVGIWWILSGGIVDVMCVEVNHIGIVGAAWNGMVMSDVPRYCGRDAVGVLVHGDERWQVESESATICYRKQQQFL